MRETISTKAIADACRTTCASIRVSISQKGGRRNRWGQLRGRRINPNPGQEAYYPLQAVIKAVSNQTLSGVEKMRRIRALKLRALREAVRAAKAGNKAALEWLRSEGAAIARELGIGNGQPETGTDWADSEGVRYG